ncbi:protein SMAX1-LIKE 3-like [Mangifera indica]|uniref:protein SMAX1-LIKE 3-like n=1 Tax=Mangifera indica TaxID=29780 RepID=UPI001CFC25FC|nr:protein SMAX1-LIKE 3-like [Mangifera indica]
MRAGLCAVPQALTAEAAGIVKQAVSLARRRGHAQVTPLHVASAMLASPAGLLRRACLQSHSHPLQCKALELCFNVALNRLPASTSSPLLGPHSPRPSLSNALVAAFKRAQAHQRRGSIENQQQPILALKIEIEQLIISILDDPSVSRVMREAGFSSSQVKTKVEEDVSLDICSQSPPASSLQPKDNTKLPQILGPSSSQSLSFSQFGVMKPIKTLHDEARNDDVMSVLCTLVNKRRNTVIVGTCLASSEGIIRGVVEKFERGQVPGDLRYAQFISLPLFSFRNSSKEEVEQKLVELRCHVKSYIGRGVVLYLGDLKWVAEFWSTYGEQRRNYYSSVEFVIMELKRLVCETRESERVWLLGIATFQTYMRCKTGHPSLETMWEFHPLTIPGGSLSLSLNLESDSPRTKAQRDGFAWPLFEGGVDNHFYSSCSPSFNRESQKKDSNNAITVAANSTLPSWLRQYKEESRKNAINDQECVNSPVQKRNKYPEKVLDFSSSSPSSVSISSWPLISEPKRVPKEHQFWVSEACEEGCESSLRNHPKPDLLSNPNSSPNSASSSELVVEEDNDGLNRFKALNDENLKILCDALERKVPWQKEIVQEIATTILQCRSKQNNSKECCRDGKEETWLLFSGADSQAKERLSREIAKIVFGSQNNFTSIGLSNFSTSRTQNKRARDEMGCTYLERFGLALNENPHRVFFMEDIEQVDNFSQKGLKQAIETGNITLPGGEIFPLKDSIIVFSCDSLKIMSPFPKASSSPSKKPKDDHYEDSENNNLKEKSSTVSLDLNIAINVEDQDHNDEVCDIVSLLESLDRQIIFKIQELS